MRTERRGDNVDVGFRVTPDNVGIGDAQNVAADANCVERSLDRRDADSVVVDAMLERFVVVIVAPLDVVLWSSGKITTYLGSPERWHLLEP